MSKKFLFFLFLTNITFVFGLNIQPPPQEIKTSKRIEKLNLPVIVLAKNNSTEVERTALKILTKEIKKNFKINPSIFTKKAVKKGTIIELGKSRNKLPEEGYIIRSLKKGRVKIIKIESNDNGIIYGVNTLLQILKQTTENNKGRISLPSKIYVYDFPVIKIRMCPRMLGYKKPKEEEVEKLFEKLCERRINSTWHIANLEWFDLLTEVGNKYGIKIYAYLSYLGESRKQGRPLCPFNKKDISLVESSFENAGKKGAYGFVFLFDDLSSEMISHVKKCPFCSKHFQNIAQLQRVFIKKMVEIGNKYGVKKFIVCPTPYMRGWEKNVITWGKPIFKNYFSDFTNDPLLKNVMVFHCEFYPDKIEELKKAGLQNYIYWINGLWSTKTWFSYYTGLTRLPWVWYGFYIDERKGPVPISEAVTHLKNIDKLTKSVFFGTGASDGLYIGGIWAWNPEKYNEEKARKYISDVLYGKGVYKYLVEYETQISKLIAYWKAYINKWTTEMSVKILPDKEIRNKEEVIKELRTSLLKVKEAYKNIEKINPHMNMLPEMKKTIVFFEGKINEEIKLEEKKQVLLNTKFEEKIDKDVIGFWRFNDEKNIGKDSSPYGNNAKIVGKPELVKGIVGKSLKLHGGKIGGGKMINGVREYLYIPSADILNIGENSFTVECWVNLEEIGWDEFVGKRATVREIYSEKGWAFGIGKDGRIRFTVDDGKKRNSISVKFIYTTWRLKKWNYIVGIRDREKKQLRLYVNGKEAGKPVKDTTEDISNKAQVKIGYDLYGGRFLNGKIDEIKITKKVLPEKEIAQKYEVLISKIK